MSISEIIKYEGDNNTFIWKHPNEDFNTTSQLIVHESQEAIFFANGQALDLFGPGLHTLETHNIPLLRKISSLPTGGSTPFHCEVYFINKVEQMSIKWGTDSKIQYIEPKYRFPISIGASGDLSLSVIDSRKLLIKIVGTEKTLYQNQVVSFLRSILMIKVKTYIAQEIKKYSINIFEIDENLEDFSNSIKNRLLLDFEDYGLKIHRFYITTIVKPDGDYQYEKFKELHFRQYADIAEAELNQKVGIIDQQTKAQQMVIESQGLAQKRFTEGYTYQQERGYDIAEGAAKNEGGSGQFTGLGIGLGMMTGIGSTIGNIVNDSFPNVTTNKNLNEVGIGFVTFCENCGNEIEKNLAFCASCGYQKQKILKCIKCNHILKVDGKFCPNCGTKRGDSSDK